MLFESTTAKIELILNALALVFILELDKVVYQAMIVFSQQLMLENIGPIRYRSRIPTTYLRYHRILFPPAAFALCFGAAIFLRAMQIHEFTKLFNSASGVCLLGGASPSE